MLWSKPMLSCTVFPGLLSLHISTLCTPPSSYLSLPWCTYMYAPLLVLRDPEREQVSVPGSVRNDPAGEPTRLSSRNASGRERTPPPGARGTACGTGCSWHFSPIFCLLGSQQGEASWHRFGHRLRVSAPHPSAGGNLPREHSTQLTASGG